MAYIQLISRARPGLIIIILDDSGSMADLMPLTTGAKCKYVEEYFRIIAEELLARSTEVKGDAHASFKLSITSSEFPFTFYHNTGHILPGYVLLARRTRGYFLFASFV